MTNPDVEPEGTREILDKLLTEAFFRPERLPGLQSLFEKIADACSERVAPLSPVQFQCALTRVNTASAGRVFEVHEGQGVWVAVNAVEWDTRLLFAVDRNTISIILELFLGTDGAEPIFVPELPLSSVSSGILRIFAEYVSTALMDGFAKLSSTTMSVEEISAKIQPDSLGNPETPVVIANYGLSAMESEGTLSIIIPKSALSPMRKSFEDTGIGQGICTPAWKQQLQSEITKTNVLLTAVLDEGTATLAEVANLKVGQVVPLSITPDSRVQVHANEEPILFCHFGQVDGAYTLRVDEFIDQKKQFIDQIIHR